MTRSTRRVQRQPERLVKIQFNLKKMKTTSFFKKKIDTTTFWINQDQLRLTFQIRDLNHETMITPNKQIIINYKAQFPINSLLNDEIGKKSIYKKDTIK